MNFSSQESDVMKAGHLEKMKNKNFLGIEVWSTRWVLLKRSGLEYFATNRPGEPTRGRIITADLKGVDVNTKKRPWGFTVYANDGTSFEFAAESKEMRDEWVGAIYWLHRDQLVANVRSALPGSHQAEAAAPPVGPSPSLRVEAAVRDDPSFNSCASESFQSFSDQMTLTPVADHPIHTKLESNYSNTAAPATPPPGARPAGAMGPPVTPGMVEETLFGKKVCKDDFDYLRVVGEGAHAKVMQVAEKSTGRMMAMKVLNKRKVIDMGQVDNIMIERRVLEQINHPFFVNLHYAFQTKDKLYLLLDFCTGGELFYHMKNEVRFSVTRCCLYAAEISCGLDHMHSMGIIYRDLKPENLLIDTEGHIRFADFGMCKRALMGGSTGGRERATSVCGTPEYMAPEVIQGNGKQEYSKGVDWWALGTLLYEMLAGRPPFYNGDRGVMFQRILHAPIPGNPYVPPAAFDLISKFLERNPRSRLGSGTNDFRTIKAHTFFASCNWERCARRQLQPEFVPVATTDYVDPMFSAEPIHKHARKSVLSPSWDESNFQGFSYNAAATDLSTSPGRR